MYYDPMPLAYAFSVMPTPAVPDEEVINAEPLATSTRTGWKWIVRSKVTDPSRSSSADGSKP
jgi:hypothetical protein